MDWEDRYPHADDGYFLFPDNHPTFDIRDEIKLSGTHSVIMANGANKDNSVMFLPLPFTLTSPGSSMKGKVGKLFTLLILLCPP